MNELENKAKELNIFDLRPFYSSPIFRDQGFRVDDEAQIVIKTY